LASINVNLYKTNPDGSQGAGNITSFATASAVTATDQDGFSAGSLNGFSLSSDRDGTIVATFTNGQTTKVGQLAIAIFNAQDGLRHMGGNFFGQTIASGQPSIGAAGTGGRGDVVGGTLEQSNVDIASELTQLIVAQRGFQANSRVITSINQTLQDLLQLV
jgi:flagellar hook protein FlgE